MTEGRLNRLESVNKTSHHFGGKHSNKTRDSRKDNRRQFDEKTFEKWAFSRLKFRKGGWTFGVDGISPSDSKTFTEKTVTLRRSLRRNKVTEYNRVENGVFIERSKTTVHIHVFNHV